jgi:hypothetical protein
MFKRRISKNDVPGVLNAMGNDLESARVMVGRMDEWATQADLNDLCDALYAAFLALKDAQETAHRTYLAVTDEEAKDR